MRQWDGLIYSEAGAVALGAVSRNAGEGMWQAWRITPHAEPEILGSHPTMEAARSAVEEACE